MKYYHFLVFQICCEQVCGVGENLLGGVKTKEWDLVVFLYLNLLIRERWRDCRLDLNMIKLLKPDVKISNLILRSCNSGFRFLQITAFKRLALSFSILYETYVLHQRKAHQIFVTTILKSDHFLSLTCESEDRAYQTERPTQRQVALELHKHHHFAMISSADGDQRLTATAFSAFICKAQSQSLFSSSSSYRCRFWVEVL